MSDQRLRTALEQARAKLEEQDEALRQLTSPPFVVALVVDIRNDCVLLNIGGALHEAELTVRGLRRGDYVRLNQQTGGLVAATIAPPTGIIAAVSAVLDEERLEVEFEGGAKRVLCTALSSPFEPGDRVVVDPSLTVVHGYLGKPPPKGNVAADGWISVAWEDIGGLDMAKDALRDAIELPVKHKQLYQYYGKHQPKGVLLDGPPGCGKTLLGKAAATSLARTHGRSAQSSGFVYVKGPEILDPFVGVSEANIRRLFAQCREHQAAHNYPAILFIDEADAVLGRRGSRPGSSIDQTIVPMFLSEMDGMDQSSAICVLATNRADTLDPAVVREGRIDRHVRVARPNREDTAKICAVHMRNMPITKGQKADELQAAFVDQLFDQARILARMVVRSGGKTMRHDFRLSDMISGAMVAAAVEQATTIALKRDIRNGATHIGKGLDRDCVLAAVEQIFQGHKAMRHDQVIAEHAAYNDMQLIHVEGV